MKKACILIAFSAFSLTSYSQIDLSKDPNKPVLQPKKSNAQLLKESQAPAQQNTDTSLSSKYRASGMSVTPGGNTYGDNGRINTQSQQYNMGGTKATSTIQYDNSGKVQGNSTTIEFGKKKK